MKVPGTVRYASPVPKLVSLSPPTEAAAGLTANRATIEDIEAALLRAPNFLASLGLHSEDGRTLPLEQLGLGHYAHAFLLPNGLVLKVTDDEDDARVCKMIMELANGKPGLPFIEAVFRLPGVVYENETDDPFERPLFAIVMEVVVPASKTRLSVTKDGERRPRLLGEAAVFPSSEELLASDEAIQFVRTIRKGLQWLGEHGVAVIDLHHGNLGYASGKRPVIVDFGHGSLQEWFEMTPIKMAANPAKKPTERQVLTVWRALGSPTVDMNELRMGIEVEQEHGVDMREAGKIAMDHLREFHDYYTRLTKMEARAKAGLAPNATTARAVARVMADLLGEEEWLRPDAVRALEGWLGDTDRTAQEIADDLCEQSLSLSALVGDDIEPNGRSMPKVRAAFDECFDALTEQFPDFGDLELHQDEKAGSDNGHGSERQFGYCMDGKPIRIAFAAKTEDLPVANIRGLMAHEFGHALDYRYGDKLGKMLGQRLPAGVERRADAIAKAVFGRTIKYDSRDIQCVACQGKSVRPRRLGP